MIFSTTYPAIVRLLAGGKDLKHPVLSRHPVNLRPGWGLSFLLLLFIAGCGTRETGGTPTTGLAVWAHAGQQRERATLEAQVARFNRAHPTIHLALTLIPEGSYNAQVQAAAIAGELPELDTRRHGFPRFKPQKRFQAARSVCHRSTASEQVENLTPGWPYMYSMSFSRSWTR